MPPDTESHPDSEQATLFAEFLDRWHAGEARLEDVCAEYPQYQDTFVRWWERLVAVGEITLPEGQAVDVTAQAAHRLGPYNLIREIGRGGQGMVYLAEDTRLRRRVALKVLVGFDTSSGERTARFVREAEMAARIDHAGLCTVYEAGIEDRVPYISMRYVEGETLAAKIDEARSKTPGSRSGSATRAEVDDALLMAERIARSLHAAHEAHLIHRDIKPRNIMVTPQGEPVILDFGLARDLGGDLSTLTATGDVFGTPAYMSPEQVRGIAKLDRRTDVFSLGSTFYELLTGRRAFDAPTREALSRAILHEDPPDPRQLQPSIPTDLAVVVMTALDKDPDRRYATALGLAEDLRRVREHEPILARPAGAWIRLRRWAARRPALATGLGALLLLLATGFALTSFFLAQVAERNADYRRMADAKRLETSEREAQEFLPLQEADVPAIRTWIARSNDLMSRLDTHRAKLAHLRTRADRVVAEGTPDARWFFEDAELQWEHDVIAELIKGLEGFSHPQRGTLGRVEGWLRFVDSVREESLVKPAETWRKAIASIRDPEQCPAYRGLQLEPQLGLVPIRRDPGSGLWEFAHLLTGAPAAPGPDDKLILTEETGLVFVLIPGGKFDMGCEAPTRERPLGQPNVDPAAVSGREGPIHEVALEPFFLSKYEMTQAQWLRFTLENPSGYPPEAEIRGHRTTLLHPVEDVTWEEVSRVTHQLGLLLPTEAQWEYAARAGTTTVWFTGDQRKSLDGYANLADAFAKQEVTEAFRQWERWLDDGYVMTAPVGSYLPNDFGLHDVAGNVCEWCRDRFALFSHPPAPGDGERHPDDSPMRVFRGGSFRIPAEFARSGCRHGIQPDLSQGDLGLRPSRPLDR